ncbi:MAG: type II toxin-antitoxin system ParD family antitoxin [Gammaproteobacteria bacterium]|nr:type II toxin-antitoxin system ParD family antitoxin [Gammaproteobacteria bacterium]
MEISLNPQTEVFVRQKLDSGYPSLSELVNEALHLMSEREKCLAELKADIQTGIEQAERGELIDAETVFEALQKRASG